MSHIYCPECGFQSPEAATYCSRCGALLLRESVGETTLSLGPDEIDAAAGARRPDRRSSCDRAAAGRGRASRRSARRRSSAAHPSATSSSTTSPSRAGTPSSSARATTYAIRDLGSLNGTFVNKHRIESTVLEDDDEVQIGKYRMTFLLRR